MVEYTRCCCTFWPAGHCEGSRSLMLRASEGEPCGAGLGRKGTGRDCEEGSSELSDPEQSSLSPQASRALGAATA